MTMIRSHVAMSSLFLFLSLVTLEFLFAQEQTFTILATSDWTSTVTVGPDTRVNISATGLWTGDPQQPLHGPDGQASGGLCGPGCPIPSARHSALVARIGNTGAPFLVGSSLQLVPTERGVLQLRINDNIVDDNLGSMTVKISLAPTEFEVGLAHFGDGQGVTSTIQIANASGSSRATVRIRFYSPDGIELLPSPLRDSQDIALEPLGSRVIQTAGTASQLRGGSMRLSSNTELAAALIFNIPGFGLVGVGESKAVKRFIVPVTRSISSNVNSGLAIANYSNSANRVTIELRNSSGSTIGTNETTLPANGQIAKFINELFPALQTAEFSGSVTATAVSSIGATAIRVSGSYMTTLPVGEIK